MPVEIHRITGRDGDGGLDQRDKTRLLIMGNGTGVISVFEASPLLIFQVQTRYWFGLVSYMRAARSVIAHSS